MSQSFDPTAYLLELFRRAKGSLQTSVSMYDVGAALGLDKTTAGKMAEEAIGKGWAEVKTLSGGICLTAEGIEAAQAAGAVTEAGASEPKLEKGPVLSQGGRATVDQILAAIKEQMAGVAKSYSRIEELVIDIKTIEVQLLSPRPKTAVVREVLISIQAAMENAGSKELAARIGRFIAK